MSPFVYDLFRLLHVVTMGLFSGALLAMLLLQSLLLRATDDAERRPLARTAATVGRVFVNPAVLFGFTVGVVWWLWFYSARGMNNLMACTPIYVHVMLTFGILAVGFTQMWKKRARLLAEALEKGGIAGGRTHLQKATLFAGLALAATLAAYVSVLFRVPNPELRNCPPPQASVMVEAPSQAC